MGSPLLLFIGGDDGLGIFMVMRIVVEIVLPFTCSVDNNL